MIESYPVPLPTENLVVRHNGPVTVIFILLCVLVILGLVFVLTGRLHSEVSPTDRPGAPDLPDGGDWDPDQVRAVRFRTGLRGYRMEDVDAVLASLARQLETSDSGRSSAGESSKPVGAEAHAPTPVDDRVEVVGSAAASQGGESETTTSSAVGESSNSAASNWGFGDSSSERAGD